MVGKRLAHCEILKPLGAGGMGELYRARGFQLDRDVVIKVLPEAVRGLQANQPLHVPATIPARTYANQLEAASTVAVESLLVGATSLDKDLVDRPMEAIFENLPDLIAQYPRAADISPATAFGLENGMPIDLHPGAERASR